MEIKFRVSRGNLTSMDYRYVDITLYGDAEMLTRIAADIEDSLDNVETVE